MAILLTTITGQLDTILTKLGEIQALLVEIRDTLKKVK